MRVWATTSLAALVAACGSTATDPDTSRRPPPSVAPSANAPAEPWSDAWLDAQASAYLDDAAFRRQALLDSLTTTDNIYAQTRASAYGRGDTGWDLLPVWNPRSRTVDAEVVERLRTSGPSPDSAETTEQQASRITELLRDEPPLWDGTRPERFDDWVSLGREVFYRYPLRAEVYAGHALQVPAVAQRVGLKPDDDGTWPGTVAFVDLDGTTKVGITCALCHVDVDDGERIEGRARRDLDYGAMRLAYHDAIDAPLAPELAERMANWGAGRADITQDDDEDPVAIVDLWGVRDRRYLTQAATLTHTHPAALAIRQETQLLHANRERVRPPRELAWALAMFVYSLEPPKRTVAAASPRGAQLFETGCARCHEDPSGAGRPRPAADVGTHPSLALGAARGTGLYRPSPLLRVGDAAPYFHDGTVATLEDVFDPRRLAPGYEGARGTGDVPGHRFGMNLDANDRQALVAYLRTL